MDQALVRLHLDSPSCGAVNTISGTDKVRCHIPGGPFGPCGWTAGEQPEGWQPILACSAGQFVRLENDDCSACPLRLLPPQVYPLNVEVRPDGLRVDLAMPDHEQVRVLLRHWAARGQGPRIVNGRTAQPDGGRLALVDLGSLTRRQREALEAAARIGYFSTGGDAGVTALADMMGCSRSTAHEHLRKGLDRLVRGTVSP